MRPRNPVLVVGSVFLAFCLGPLLGVGVAHGSAPGSELAQIVSPLAFALTFAGGLLLWFGIGAASLVGGALARLVRRGSGARRAAPASETLVPSGHAAFLPLALALGGAAGLVVGLVPQSGSLLGALALHLAAAAGYGSLLRALARRGYLPFPEPS